MSHSNSHTHDPATEPGGFATEESIYSIVLVSGVIVVSGPFHATSWEVLTTVIATVVVFWAAHLYAGTLAEIGDAGSGTSLRSAFSRSLRRNLGFLVAAFPLALVLFLGALRAIDDTAALWVALWVGVVILAIVGYRAFSVRGYAWHFRALGAVATAALGLIMIGLKAVIH